VSLLNDRNPDTISKIEIVGTVSWRTHPNKCWDFSHRKVNPTPHAGMQLSIYDCTSRPDKFIIPVKGSGPIKIDGYENLCLDSPSGAQLQFWTCDKAAKANTEFVPNARGKGIYHLKSRPERCIDVPNHDPSNGNRIQMWHCNQEHQEDMHFSIHAPVDCKWTVWSQWGSCSEACGGGKSLRRRVKTFGVVVRKSETGESFFYALRNLTHTQGGGKECQGDPSELQDCNPQECTGNEKRSSGGPPEPVAAETSGLPAGSTGPGGLPVQVVDDDGSQGGKKDGAAHCWGAVGWMSSLFVLATAMHTAR